MEQITLTAYDDFVEKFKPKKTTDDCYTPPEVFEAIQDWAVERYGLQGRPLVRPFYPGGDYERHEYPEHCVVLDNPPFSILAKICRFYLSRNIDFFLYGPGLSIFKPEPEINYVITDTNIKYENGAEVPTCFCTNLGDCKFETAPELTAKIKAIQKGTGALPRYEYPPEIITAAKLRYIDSKGIKLRIERAPMEFVRKIEANKKGIFGGGFLLGEKAAAAAAAAAAEDNKQYFQLSTKERELVAYLTKLEDKQ